MLFGRDLQYCSASDVSILQLADRFTIEVRCGKVIWLLADSWCTWSCTSLQPCYLQRRFLINVWCWTWCGVMWLYLIIAHSSRSATCLADRFNMDVWSRNCCKVATRIGYSLNRSSSSRLFRYSSRWNCQICWRLFAWAFLCRATAQGDSNNINTRGEQISTIRTGPFRPIWFTKCPNTGFLSNLFDLRNALKLRPNCT